MNKYLGIDTDLRPDISIIIRKPFLTKRRINIMLGTGKYITKPTPVVNPPLAKNEGDQLKRD